MTVEREIRVSALLTEVKLQFSLMRGANNAPVWTLPFVNENGVVMAMTITLGLTAVIFAHQLDPYFAQGVAGENILRAAASVPFAKSIQHPDGNFAVVAEMPLHNIDGPSLQLGVAAVLQLIMLVHRLRPTPSQIA